MPTPTYPFPPFKHFLKKRTRMQRIAVSLATGLLAGVAVALTTFFTYPLVTAEKATATRRRPQVGGGNNRRRRVRFLDEEEAHTPRLQKVGGKGDDAVVDLGASGAEADAFLEETHPDKTRILFVYADWCGHCRNMKAAYHAAARELAGRRDDIVFGKVDGSGPDAAEFSERMGIQGFPHIVRYIPETTRPFGATETRVRVTPYAGDRSKEDLVRFAEGRRGRQSRA